MTLQNYEWQVDGRPDGKLRRAGDLIKMTEAEAKYHLQNGHLKLVQSAVKAPSKPTQKRSKTETSKPAATKSATSSSSEVDAKT